MKRKVYMEITNVCNLSCSFCPGTKREKGRMTLDDFRLYAQSVKGFAEYLYFHLMGEPLLHPDLCDMIRYARDLGMKPIITTNGTLLSRRGDEILDAGIHKVSISLHSFEANDGVDFSSYINDCISFAKKAGERGSFCALRLWNLQGGRNEKNEEILSLLHTAFPEEWKKNRSGYCIGQGVYLEWGRYFDWPDPEASDLGENCFCFGLRDQIGVLTDGRVVPCCMDKDGDLVLGNLREQSLDEILSSSRAKAIYDGFTSHRAVESLCLRCGFAHDLKSSEK